MADNVNLNTPDKSSTLDAEDEHIQLAVDLIYLLETNKVDPAVAVKALNIVTADFERKLLPT